MTYFVLGKWIVEEQQNGDNRAKYGQKILLQLSEKINPPKDGKYYKTDVVNKKNLLRIIQSIPSPKLVTNYHQLKMKTIEIKSNEE